MTAFFKAAAAICDIFPGWLWAIVCAGLLAVTAGMGMQRDAARDDAKSARSERDQARGELAQLQAAVKTMKQQAAAELAALKAKADQLQADLNDARRAQEIKDANAQATVDRYTRKLASVRLRDPYAAGCRSGGASAQGATGNDSDHRAADPADAPGLLSERTSEDLRRLERIADTVNIAYASCRAQLINDRAVLGTGP